MRYKHKQTLNQSDRQLGKEFNYSMSKMPKHMEPSGRQVNGSVTQPATCTNLLNSKVMVRGPRYTFSERSRGTAGLLDGRRRFVRQVELLNRIQPHTNAFPEPLDLVYVHNRDDFGAHEEELARQEPRLVTELLRGDSLDRFGDLKGSYSLYNPNNVYWFQHKSKTITDENRFGALSVRRVAQLLARLATHCGALLKARVVHLDLKPEHVFILSKDEVPRLLGLGHLAPLDKAGKLDPKDPVHAFTTAGYVAPELVSDEGWNRPQDGEALMLYSLGAIALSLLYTGPQANLSEIWRFKGREGIDALIQQMRAQRVSKRHKKLYEVIEKLLEPQPQRRKQLMTMTQLVDEMNALRYESPRGPQVEMRCQRCKVRFKGPKEGSYFKYRSERYTLCPEHFKEAHSKTSYVASRCGHTIIEPLGVIWGREWHGWNARARCSDCQSS